MLGSKLPRGIALVLVQTPLGKVGACSDRLSEGERRIALAVAHDRIARGIRAVVLGELEVAELERETV